MPDLLGYWLTGRAASPSETNASTTGLLDVRTGDWAPELVEALGLPAGLLPDVAARRAGRWPPLAGRGAGRARRRPRAAGHHGRLARHRLGGRRRARRRTRGSATSPAAPGGWSASSSTRRCSPRTAARANFTNERGVDGTIRYLRNVMGLWLLSGVAADLEPARARRRARRGCSPRRPRCRAGGPRVDPDDPAFLPPGDMPARIAAGLPAHAGDAVPEPRRGRPLHPRQPRGRVRRRDRRRRSGCPASRSRSCTSSAAGSQNALLCQLTADACRPPGASPARSRRPRWATCWCRPAPTACWPATWPRCGRGSAAPSAWTGTSRADRLRPSAGHGRACRPPDRPIRHARRPGAHSIGAWRGWGSWGPG